MGAHEQGILRMRCRIGERLLWPTRMHPPTQRPVSQIAPAPSRETAPLFLDGAAVRGSAGLDGGNFQSGRPDLNRGPLCETEQSAIEWSSEWSVL